ncbi:MAG: YhfC family glutamic-type intramembrane protease [Chloroflexota bacterium]|nr:YhfC family glutamic-type intramembrane protease [Chloroflexota bacterium]
MLAAAHLLNGLLMIALPLVLGVVLARRWRLGWGFFGAGAATFVASQLLHIPFNYLVLNPFVTERGMFAAGGLAFIAAALLYGLSAGVFEEVARFVVMRRWTPESRNLPNALMFGAGHGGSEAIIIGGFALYGFFQAVALRGADLAQTLPPEQVDIVAAQMALYWNMPWYKALLGAVERAGAICFHLSASAMVLQSVRRGGWGWLAGAVAWHTLFNAVTLIVMDRWGVYAAEGIVIVGAGISLLIIFAIKAMDAPGEDLEADPPNTPPPNSRVLRIADEDIADDSLEDSRYA